MKSRDEALKLLLESNITKDLGDIDMVNRIVDAFQPIIDERNRMNDENMRYRDQRDRDTTMRDSIRKLLEGEVVEEWS